ncbi:unnamed protein product, partial [Mesorhabditis belari]|uniref:UPAR/Ly6 domain-containing protein n=1 Tax=Mesorhabditis belari TaxID=2138241 RepID=A0AAF3J1F8_9BILA
MLQRLAFISLLCIFSITFALQCYEDSGKKDKFSSSKTKLTCNTKGQVCSDFCLKTWLTDPTAANQEQHYEWDCGCGADQSGRVGYNCSEAGVKFIISNGISNTMECCTGDLCNTASSGFFLISLTLSLFVFLSRC